MVDWNGIREVELVNGFRDKSKLPGLVCLSRLEHQPPYPKVAALIPGQGTVGVGGGGKRRRATNHSSFFSLSKRKK